MFSTAGRSVKTGLVAAAVVSSWTWAATLLQSTTVTYEYGVSGAFFYASGMSISQTGGQKKRREIAAIWQELCITHFWENFSIYRCDGSDHPLRNACD